MPDKSLENDLAHLAEHQRLQKLVDDQNGLLAPIKASDLVTRQIAADLETRHAFLDKAKASIKATKAAESLWIKEAAQKTNLLDQLSATAKASGISDIYNLAGKKNLGTAWEIARDSGSFERLFSVPDIYETSRLYSLASSRSGNQFLSITQAFQGIGEQQRMIGALASMKMPWLRDLDKLSSIRGIAELQAIGQALNTLPPYAEEFANALRLDVGDFRDPITWSTSVEENAEARTAFYVERGFNTELTDFPEPAFQESLWIAKVTDERPLLVQEYGHPVLLFDDPKDEADAARTNSAHDWIYRLETQLRSFIDVAMTARFGPDWPRTQLPNNMYEKWLEKKADYERLNGHIWPVISYADFTDYSVVICKKDNWREVFQPIFQTPESVRESFQRLHPIRISTMHSRPVTQDDELLLFVEARRLSLAMKQVKLN